MKFKDKKEYYSLRKFKGVGLASAVVGLAILSPSVLAEEVSTYSNTDKVSLVKSTDNDSNVSNLNTADVVKSEVSSEPKATVSSNVVETKQTLDNSSQNVTDAVSVTDNHVNKEVNLSNSKDEVSKPLEYKESLVSAKSEDSSPNEPARSRRGKRDTSSQESPYVSDKAKEVVRELNDTLVMKKEDTASTSDTLFKLDDGVKPTEEEKAYVNTIKAAFNDLPELVRSNVNSLTIVRKPNGLYGYTYSKEGNVNMNMQYYHPELTHGEEGSLQ